MAKLPRGYNLKSTEDLIKDLQAELDAKYGIEEAEVIEDEFTDEPKKEEAPKQESSGTGLEVWEPDKYDMYKELGYNEMTRVISVTEGEHQIVKIKEDHQCQPPRINDFGIGSVWKCGCGARWKVKRHALCDNSSHNYTKKWRRQALGFFPVGSSRFS